MVSGGHALLEPVQASAPSQVPVEGRHVVPPVTTISVGQVSVVPVQLSATSQPPATAALHTMLLGCFTSAGQASFTPSHLSATSQAPPELRHVKALVCLASDGQTLLEPVQVSALSQRSTAPRHVVALDTKFVSAGQALLDPVQASAPSHVPVDGRHTVPTFTTVSLGQLMVPVHVSATSQPPATAARHTVPTGARVSAGQGALLPSHTSAASQLPTAAARHTVPAVAAGQLHTPALQVSTVQALPSLQSAALVHAAQVPLLQKPLHTLPQLAQLARVPRVSSQPLPSVLSQLPKPLLQVAMAQLPVPQVAVALVREQAVPHEPQLLSVCRSVSQLSLSLLQSSKPLSQVVTLHVLLLQSPTAVPGNASQSLVHAPQLWSSLRRSDSQPSLATPLQSLKYVCEQLAMLQMRAAGVPPQPGVAFGRLHTVLQLPQCRGELSAVSQLFLSLSQSAKSCLQPATSQVRLSQVALALAMAQPWPQVPQLLSVSSRVSQPFL